MITSKKRYEKIKLTLGGYFFYSKSNDRRILVKDWKARIFRPFDPTARWHRTICNSPGNLDAIARNRVAVTVAATGLVRESAGLS